MLETAFCLTTYLVTTASASYPIPIVDACYDFCISSTDPPSPSSPHSFSFSLSVKVEVEVEVESYNG